MSEGQIRIGIGGWTYPPWRGVFYPDKLPQAKELEYASRALGAIEINSTFYGRQSPKSWAAWEKVAPESFRDEKFFDLCRARNVAVVFDDSDDYPSVEADTADFSYARLQRMREEVPTGYDDQSLDAFAERAHGWARRGDVYIFMINGAK